jgi:transcriptional regulator with XRE-family HTH domain
MRRKLSLEDVATLTKSYPEPINKGYLSRVERGLARVGFSKMVASSHAYDVSLDVFRREARARSRSGPVEGCAGHKREDVWRAVGRDSVQRDAGMRHVYACVRDASQRHRSSIRQSRTDEDRRRRTFG